jgi:hypothetical protein
MAYTATDLANVQAALVDLARGKRVVSVTVGDKTISYGPAQIRDLKDLRDEIRGEVETTSTQKRFVLTRTEKGL